jgi:hypothetical protein
VESAVKLTDLLNFMAQQNREIDGFAGCFIQGSHGGLGKFEEFIIGSVREGEPDQTRTGANEALGRARNQSGSFQTGEQPGQGALGQATDLLELAKSHGRGGIHDVGQ